MPSHRRISKIEAKLDHLFGEETSLKDIILADKFAKLFGDENTPNKTIIRQVRMEKKLIKLFGAVPTTTKKLKLKKKKSKKLQAKIKMRIEHLFGIENTKKDILVAKKIVHLFGEE